MQKTRPQNIDIWPNDGHFMTIKKISAEIFKNFKSQNFRQLFLLLISSQYLISMTTPKNDSLYYLIWGEGGGICLAA